MTQGLNVGRLVRVSVNLAPMAAARRGFGTLLIAGDSNVINAGERLRTYVDLESVAFDFGMNAPEYAAAALYFGQTPRPQTLMIGRWVRTPTAAVLSGAILTPEEQKIDSFVSIKDGSFKVDVDGQSVSVVGVDLTDVTNMNGVASKVNAKASLFTISWNGQRFTIMSKTTGQKSTLGYASSAGAGTDLSAKLKLSKATAQAINNGMDTETPAECAAVLANASGMWYGLTFAASVMPTPEELIDVSTFIEGASISRIFGVTETDTRVLDATYKEDIASKMKALKYKRTCVQYARNPYAIASLFGRAFSVNFSANRSTITLMFKQEPGVVAEDLTESQALALKAKRCNVFVAYMNDTAIIQYGVMSGQAYFDEMHGLDWFADALQTSQYNLLYQSKTKVPQTDAGQNQLVTVASTVCLEAVNNGLVAPGQWNADGFGQLERGDFLSSGFYIYTQPMALQDQSMREQRIAPPIQIALKLAGAIHEIDCIVDVNR